MRISTIVDLSEIDVLISDDGVSGEARRELDEHDPGLVIAEVQDAEMENIVRKDTL